MDHGGPKGFPEDDRGPPPDRRDPRNRDRGGAGGGGPPQRTSEPRGDPRGSHGRGPPQDSRGPPMGGAPQRPPMGGPGGGQPPRLPEHLAGADPEKAQLIMQVQGFFK